MLPDPSSEDELDVVPVIDLKGGAVVRARGGARHLYAPIATPLARTSRPHDVVAGFRALFSFRKIYIADLDAISGTGDHDAIIAELETVFPEIEFWVDSGIATEASAAAWLQHHRGALRHRQREVSPISIIRHASICRGASSRWIFAATTFSDRRNSRPMPGFGRCA